MTNISRDRLVSKIEPCENVFTLKKGKKGGERECRGLKNSHFNHGHTDECFWTRLHSLVRNFPPISTLSQFQPKSTTVNALALSGEHLLGAGRARARGRPARTMAMGMTMAVGMAVAMPVGPMAVPVALVAGGTARASGPAIVFRF